MAEIRIEKKKPVWPWVLVLLLIVGVIAAVFLWDDDDTEDDVAAYGEEYEDGDERSDNTANWSDTSDNTQASARANAVEDYRQHLRNENDRLGADYTYTQQSFVKLHSALQYTASRQNYDRQLDLSGVKTWSDGMANEPRKWELAAEIKQGMGAVLAAFQNLQKAKYPDLDGEIDDLKDLHEEMEPGMEREEQKETIVKFFEEAEEILGKMEKENNNS